VTAYDARMPHASRFAILVPLLAAALCACDRGGGSDTAGGAPAPAVPNDASFHARLKAAAAGLDEMGRVDDATRWAPALCMAPFSPPLRFSASADGETHGGKLYSMYAKDRGAYVALTDSSARMPSRPTEVAGLEDCSQVVVKESFAPEEAKTEDPADPLRRRRLPGAGAAPAADDPVRARPPSLREGLAHRLRPATRDGKRFTAGASRGLFVMLRLDPKTPATDDGWVYGTIAADGTITSAGRVASCMSCHAKAPHGRLFGLPPAGD
jgi:hypothetical protein